MSLPSRRTAALKPTAVNAILAEVRARQAAGKPVVSLMRGEPDFATPAHIVDAACRALRDGRTGYPHNQGEPSLREAVAAKLSRDNGLSYSVDEEILITTGATFGIYAALAAVLDPGDEILVPNPIYDAYQSVIALVGGIAKPVAATVAADRFALTPAAQYGRLFLDSLPDCRDIIEPTVGRKTGDEPTEAP